MTPQLATFCYPLILAARPEADPASAQIDQSVADIWLIVGLAAQVIITLTFVWQWFQSNRRGRFWLSPFAAAVAMLATAGLLVYAWVRGDPVFIFGEFVYLVIAMRMLYLARQFQMRIHNAQWPGFPRVSPEVAEQRHSETTATLSGEFHPPKR